MYTFDNGVAYRFNACIKGKRGNSFIAVVAERSSRTSCVSFVMPHEIIAERPEVFDGREVIKVNVDGRDYTASAALPLDITASVELLDQMKSARG